MKLDIQSFFQACDPSKTLVVEQPQDRQYYIDFSKVRGGTIIQELHRTITYLLPEKATCQLFTGHIGCGKSTELQRLKAGLEQSGFHVVYFESSQSLDMADVDVTDILLAIAREVSQSLEAIKISLKPSYFQKLFAEVGDFLLTPIELKEIELSAGIAKITTKTKDSPKLRSQLRQYLEPRTSSLLEAINEELLKPARVKLLNNGKKGLVVIVDNLDRVDNSLKPTGYYQPEYLFVERGDQLNKLNCHVVYTVPLILIFSNTLGRLTNRFGVEPKVLPMVPVLLRDNTECKEGITLLQKMLMARAFPGVSWEQSSKLVTQVFDSHDTLERLCRASGGHLRNLLGLLFRCLQKENPPISRQCLESVIRQRRNELALTITHDEWDLLRALNQQKTFSGHERYELLIRSMFVFEYRDDDGSWFDINPILRESKEFTL
ncbi:hypothetical protein CAL7716_059530 [Calothrix sp. PCC 7716]|nr:hypothetical protein CAL7716_059530 [Calothrix sp. PCC 7716]